MKIVVDTVMCSRRGEWRDNWGCGSVSVRLKSWCGVGVEMIEVVGNCWSMHNGGYGDDDV